VELRRVIWSWETALGRLVEREPSLGRAARRSCRPIAAERTEDGRLALVLGCWWPPDLNDLREATRVSRLDSALSEFLDDQVRTTMAPWPGGMAPPRPEPEPDEVQPPDVLVGLPREAREAATACESALERLLFARAWTRGLRLVCQYRALNYRLDFALPQERLGAEVIGWHGPRPGRTARWEREQQLGADAWRIFYFPGAVVHRDVERCVDELVTAARADSSVGEAPSSQRSARGTAS
jgi:very-short-patch-repair endonuclease